MQSIKAVLDNKNIAVCDNEDGVTIKSEDNVIHLTHADMRLLNSFTKNIEAMRVEQARKEALTTFQVPANGLKMWKFEGRLMCLSDFNNEVNYVIQDLYIEFTRMKKENKLPPFSREKVYSTATKLMDGYELLKGVMLCI